MTILPILKSSKRLGFTLIELIVTLGIISLLVGLVTVNLLGLHEKATIDSAYTQVISDLKSQQSKSMTGVNDSGTGLFGVHFAANQYTLFRGLNYSPSNPSNFDITLEGSLTATTAFAGSDLIFATSSGEVVNFVPGQNTITLQDQYGKQKTITLNEYGTVMSVN